MSRTPSLYFAIATWIAISAYSNEQTQSKTEDHAVTLGAKNKSHQPSAAGLTKTPPSELPPSFPNTPCPETWRMSADFLFFLPSFDDTYFVFKSDLSSSLPFGKRFNNDFSFKPGFRVAAEYALCGTKRGFKSSYSYLNGEENKTINGLHLWASLNGIPDASAFSNYEGIASSNLSCLFQGANALFSQQVLNCFGMVFSLEPGIEYAYLRLNEMNEYATAIISGEIKRKSRTWGIGPQIGLGIDYNFYQRTLASSKIQVFSIDAHFAGGLLASRATTHVTQFFDHSPILSSKDLHTWRMVSALHAKVGLNYLVRGSCFDLSAGIGYEFNTYLRAVGRSIFFSNSVVVAGIPASSSAICSTSYYDFDTQGLYINGAVAF